MREPRLFMAPRFREGDRKKSESDKKKSEDYSRRGAKMTGKKRGGQGKERECTTFSELKQHFPHT